MFPSSGFAAWAILAGATLNPPADEARIAALVAKLAAPDYRSREQALRELTALGDAARPQLVKAAESTDNPEIERRLEVLVAKIDRDRLVQPKRITLKGKLPVPDILKQIANQTGYRFAGEPNDANLKMIVDWNGVPFWDAIDEISTATGYGVQMGGEESGALSFYNNETFDPHVYRTGPYRIVATNVGTNANRQLSGLPRKGLPFVHYGGMNLNLMLLSEPKNPMIGTATPVIAKAVDDTGRNLAQADDGSNFSTSYYGGGSQRGHSMYLYANLGKPGKDATIIKELRGTVSVSLLAGTRPELTIDNLMKAKGKTFVSRAAEVTVDSVGEPGDNGFSVGLTAKLLQPNGDDYSWSNAFPQRLEVYDAEGRKYQNAGVSAQTPGPGSNTVTVQFTLPEGKKLGPPARLVVVEWLAVRREVEFVFKDIPLP